MNRPVRVIGANQPGQFMATRVRVLAAEMAGPQRLGRGRQYVNSGAVVDVQVSPGLATAVVQGSRRAPYVVELGVTPGHGPPARSEVEAVCSCPDGVEAIDGVCKHAVAAIIVVADAIAVEPDTLHRWRSRAPGRHPHAPAATADDDTDVRSVARPSSADPLAGALRVPAGSEMPEIPELEPAPPLHLDDAGLAALLHGAYDAICDRQQLPSGTTTAAGPSDPPS